MIVSFTMPQIPLPAMLKLEFGSSAVGVKLVHSLPEAARHVRHVQGALRGEADHPGVGLGHGRSLVLTPRLLGSEHDVDVVLFRGQLMAAFVSDNGPTRLPLCLETAAVLPSVLHQGESHGLSGACRQLLAPWNQCLRWLSSLPPPPLPQNINLSLCAFVLAPWNQCLRWLSCLCAFVLVPLDSVSKMAILPPPLPHGTSAFIYLCVPSSLPPGISV